MFSEFLVWEHFKPNSESCHTVYISLTGILEEGREESYEESGWHQKAEIFLHGSSLGKTLCRGGIWNTLLDDVSCLWSNCIVFFISFI